LPWDECFLFSGAQPRWDNEPHVPTFRVFTVNVPMIMASEPNSYPCKNLIKNLVATVLKLELWYMGISQRAPLTSTCPISAEINYIRGLTLATPTSFSTARNCQTLKSRVYDNGNTCLFNAYVRSWLFRGLYFFLGFACSAD